MTFGSSKDEGDVPLEAGERLFLGMDFGTSGARYAVIDKDGTIRAEGKRDYPLYMVRRLWSNPFASLMFALIRLNSWSWFLI